MDKQFDYKDFANSLEDYLKDKRYKGVKFPLGEMGAVDINMYIMNGVFFTHNGSGMLPKVEVCLPEDKLLKCCYIEVPKKMTQLRESVRATTDYRKGIQTLLDGYPPLKDATLTSLSAMDSFNMSYIDEQPMSKAVAYMLHKPNANTLLLQDFLHRNLPLPIEENIMMNPDMRRRMEQLGLPDNMRCKLGAECFYFFEKGTLGYATVHPNRSVKWQGEPMSEQTQDHIRRIATRSNINYLNKTFFLNRAVGRINMQMVDTITGEYRDIHLQKYSNDEKEWDVLMEKGQALPEEQIKRLLSMKGRVTQPQLSQRENGSYLRCRIDGQQQLYKKIKPEDLQKYEKGEWDGQELAARYFSNEFLATVNQSKGLKR